LNEDKKYIGQEVGRILHKDGRILNRKRKKILLEDGKNIGQEEGRRCCMRMEKYWTVGTEG
jgi:hypothetical protein